MAAAILMMNMQSQKKVVSLCHSNELKTNSYGSSYINDEYARCGLCIQP